MWNRYPDPLCEKLRQELGNYVKMDPEMIAVGNGSDELISIIMKSLIKNGDRVVVLEPSFSMYSFYGEQIGLEMIGFNLDEDFKFNLKELKKTLIKYKPRMLILCNPNNPNGGVIELSEIKDILEDYKGYLLLDEAYYEFYGVSGIELLSEFNNLIILRTLSKALGIAALRVGYVVASKEIIKKIFEIKSPYNVNSLTQAAAIKVLKYSKELLERVEVIKTERERVYEELTKLKNINIAKSYGNFLLIKASNSLELSKVLKGERIEVRAFDTTRLKDYIRVTIGIADQNDRVISCFRRCFDE
jgi:histidinol-phosphate aminotransferase